MKLLTKSATFFNILKIEIHPEIYLINLGSIKRALKSVRKFTLQITDIVLLKIDIVLLKIDIVLLNIKKTVML